MYENTFFVAELFAEINLETRRFYDLGVRIGIDYGYSTTFGYL